MTAFGCSTEVNEAVPSGICFDFEAASTFAGRLSCCVRSFKLAPRTDCQELVQGASLRLLTPNLSL